MESRLAQLEERNRKLREKINEQSYKWHSIIRHNVLDRISNATVLLEQIRLDQKKEKPIDPEKLDVAEGKMNHAELLMNNPHFDTPYELIDAHDFFTKAIAVMKSEFAEPLRLVADVHPDLKGVMLQLKPDAVREAMQVLVDNAARATLEATNPRGKPKPIRVRVRPFGKSHVWIQVVDQGIGVQPKNIKRLLFEPFTTKTEPGEHGKGLLAAKEVIEGLHEGRFKPVQSKFRKGTKISFTLPSSFKEEPVTPVQSKPGKWGIPIPLLRLLRWVKKQN